MIDFLYNLLSASTLKSSVIKKQGLSNKKDTLCYPERVMPP